MPLLITEGVRKADAAVSVGLCCVALMGTWCWRGTNDAGGKTLLADFESIALNGRTVYVVFDSDVILKRSVHAALRAARSDSEKPRSRRPDRPSPRRGRRREGRA